MGQLIKGQDEKELGYELAKALQLDHLMDRKVSDLSGDGQFVRLKFVFLFIIPRSYIMMKVENYSALQYVWLPSATAMSTCTMNLHRISTSNIGSSWIFLMFIARAVRRDSIDTYYLFFCN